MFLRRIYNTHPDFGFGVRQMLPQSLGISAWGLMTGVAMVKSGMSVVEALAMALFVYAGSSQLAAIPLLLVGAPLWIILATAFCVNLRFVVFSLHLRSYLIHLPRLERLVTGYLTTDITYVLFVQRYPQPGQTPEERIARQAYLAGNSLVNWSNWVGSSVIGIALANFIPSEWGLGFAGILCLVGILCSLASTRLRILSAVLAGVAAVVAYALPLKLNIIVAIAVAVFACLALEKTRPVAAAQEPRA